MKSMVPRPSRETACPPSDRLEVSRLTGNQYEPSISVNNLVVILNKKPKGVKEASRKKEDVSKTLESAKVSLSFGTNSLQYVDHIQ